MNAAKMKEILRNEYGIRNENEFNAAVKGFAGINLGVFTMPIEGRRIIDEQEKAEKITA